MSKILSLLLLLLAQDVLKLYPEIDIQPPSPLPRFPRDDLLGIFFERSSAKSQRFYMDLFEITAPGASGEAVFLKFDEKWLLDLGMDKMGMNGGLQLCLQKVPKLSKE